MKSIKFIVEIQEHFKSHHQQTEAIILILTSITLRKTNLKYAVNIYGKATTVSSKTENLYAEMTKLIMSIHQLA